MDTEQRAPFSTLPAEARDRIGKAPALDPALKEAVARKLYAIWCANGGHNPEEPEWEKFEAGAALNPIGLNADDFRESAEAIAPFDSEAAVARRMCMNNHIPECLIYHKCTEATCIGADDWAADAKEILALVRERVTG